MEEKEKSAVKKGIDYLQSIIKLLGAVLFGTRIK